uniref:Uncharacterized protein n=1 Tax=Anguilla anguilla TaxID=7936 RepID=A0A0E9WCN6_ANGAN
MFKSNITLTLTCRTVATILTHGLSAIQLVLSSTILAQKRLNVLNVTARTFCLKKIKNLKSGGAKEQTTLQIF